MPAPLSMDLRKRVIDAWKSEGLSREELGRRFCIGPATAYRLVCRYRETGSVAPAENLGGEPLRLLDGEALEVLAGLVTERRDRTIAELRDLLDEEANINVSTSTVSRGLGRLGLTRKKRLLKPMNGTLIA